MVEFEFEFDTSRTQQDSVRGPLRSGNVAQPQVIDVLNVERLEAHAKAEQSAAAKLEKEGPAAVIPGTKGGTGKQEHPEPSMKRDGGEEEHRRDHVEEEEINIQPVEVAKVGAALHHFREVAGVAPNTDSQDNPPVYWDPRFWFLPLDEFPYHVKQTMYPQNESPWLLTQVGAEKANRELMEEAYEKKQPLVNARKKKMAGRGVADVEEENRKILEEEPPDSSQWIVSDNPAFGTAREAARIVYRPKPLPTLIALATQRQAHVDRDAEKSQRDPEKNRWHSDRWSVADLQYTSSTATQQQDEKAGKILLHERLNPIFPGDNLPEVAASQASAQRVGALYLDVESKMRTVVDMPVNYLEGSVPVDVKYADDERKAAEVRAEIARGFVDPDTGKSRVVTKDGTDVLVADKKATARLETVRQLLGMTNWTSRAEGTERTEEGAGPQEVVPARRRATSLQWSFVENTPDLVAKQVEFDEKTLPEEQKRHYLSSSSIFSGSGPSSSSDVPKKGSTSFVRSRYFRGCPLPVHVEKLAAELGVKGVKELMADDDIITGTSSLGGDDYEGVDSDVTHPKAMLKEEALKRRELARATSELGRAVRIMGADTARLMYCADEDTTTQIFCPNVHEIGVTFSEETQYGNWEESEQGPELVFFGPEPVRVVEERRFHPPHDPFHHSDPVLEQAAKVVDPQATFLLRSVEFMMQYGRLSCGAKHRFANNCGVNYSMRDVYPAGGSQRFICRRTGGASTRKVEGADRADRAAGTGCCSRDEEGVVEPLSKSDGRAGTWVGAAKQLHDMAEGAVTSSEKLLLILPRLREWLGNECLFSRAMVTSIERFENAVYWTAYAALKKRMRKVRFNQAYYSGVLRTLQMSGDTEDPVFTVQKMPENMTPVATMEAAVATGDNPAGYDDATTQTSKPELVYWQSGLREHLAPVTFSSDRNHRVGKYNVLSKFPSGTTQLWVTRSCGNCGLRKSGAAADFHQNPFCKEEDLRYHEKAVNFGAGTSAACVGGCLRKRRIRRGVHNDCRRQINQHPVHVGVMSYDLADFKWEVDHAVGADAEQGDEGRRETISMDLQTVLRANSILPSFFEPDSVQRLSDILKKKKTTTSAQESDAGGATSTSGTTTNKRTASARTRKNKPFHTDLSTNEYYLWHGSTHENALRMATGRRGWNYDPSDVELRPSTLTTKSSSRAQRYKAEKRLSIIAKLAKKMHAETVGSGLEEETGNSGTSAPEKEDAPNEGGDGAANTNRAPAGHWFGQGMYWTPQICKAVMYAREEREQTLHAEETPPLGRYGKQYFLLSRVSLGRVCQLLETVHWLMPEDFEQLRGHCDTFVVLPGWILRGRGGAAVVKGEGRYHVWHRQEHLEIITFSEAQSYDEYIVEASAAEIDGAFSPDRLQQVVRENFRIPRTRWRPEVVGDYLRHLEAAVGGSRDQHENAETGSPEHDVTMEDTSSEDVIHEPHGGMKAHDGDGAHAGGGRVESFAQGGASAEEGEAAAAASTRQESSVPPATVELDEASFLRDLSKRLSNSGGSPQLQHRLAMHASPDSLTAVRFHRINDDNDVLRRFLENIATGSPPVGQQQAPRARRGREAADEGLTALYRSLFRHRLVDYMASEDSQGSRREGDREQQQGGSTKITSSLLEHQLSAVVSDLEHRVWKPLVIEHASFFEQSGLGSFATGDKSRFATEWWRPSFWVGICEDGPAVVWNKAVLGVVLEAARRAENADALHPNMVDVPGEDEQVFKKNLHSGAAAASARRTNKAVAGAADLLSRRCDSFWYEHDCHRVPGCVWRRDYAPILVDAAKEMVDLEEAFLIRGGATGAETSRDESSVVKIVEHAVRTVALRPESPRGTYGKTPVLDKTGRMGTAPTYADQWSVNRDPTLPASPLVVATRSFEKLLEERQLSFRLEALERLRRRRLEWQGLKFTRERMEESSEKESNAFSQTARDVFAASSRKTNLAAEVPKQDQGSDRGGGSLLDSKGPPFSYEKGDGPAAATSGASQVVSAALQTLAGPSIDSFLSEQTVKRTMVISPLLMVPSVLRKGITGLTPKADVRRQQLAGRRVAAEPEFFGHRQYLDDQNTFGWPRDPEVQKTLQELAVDRWHFYNVEDGRGDVVVAAADCSGGTGRGSGCSGGSSIVPPVNAWQDARQLLWAPERIERDGSGLNEQEREEVKEQLRREGHSLRQLSHDEEDTSRSSSVAKNPLQLLEHRYYNVYGERHLLPHRTDTMNFEKSVARFGLSGRDELPRREEFDRIPNSWLELRKARTSDADAPLIEVLQRKAYANWLKKADWSTGEYYEADPLITKGNEQLLLELELVRKFASRLQQCRSGSTRGAGGPPSSSCVQGEAARERIMRDMHEQFFAVVTGRRPKPDDLLDVVDRLVRRFSMQTEFEQVKKECGSSCPPDADADAGAVEPPPLPPQLQNPDSRMRGHMKLYDTFEQVEAFVPAVFGERVYVQGRGLDEQRSRDSVSVGTLELAVDDAKKNEMTLRLVARPAAERDDDGYHVGRPSSENHRLWSWPYSTRAFRVKLRPDAVERRHGRRANSETYTQLQYKYYLSTDNSSRLWQWQGGGEYLVPTQHLQMFGIGEKRDVAGAGWLERGASDHVGNAPESRRQDLHSRRGAGGPNEKDSFRVIEAGGGRVIEAGGGNLGQSLWLGKGAGKCAIRRSRGDQVHEFSVDQQEDRDELERLWDIWADSAQKLPAERATDMAKLWTFALRLHDRAERGSRRKRLLADGQACTLSLPGNRIRLSKTREELTVTVGEDEDLIVLDEVRDQDLAYEAFVNVQRWHERADASAEAKAKSVQELVDMFHELRDKIGRGARKAKLGFKNGWLQLIGIRSAAGPFRVSVKTEDLSEGAGGGEDSKSKILTVYPDAEGRRKLGEGFEKVMRAAAGGGGEKVDAVLLTMVADAVREIVLPLVRAQETERVRKVAEEHRLPYIDDDAEVEGGSVNVDLVSARPPPPGPAAGRICKSVSTSSSSRAAAASSSTDSAMSPTMDHDLAEREVRLSRDADRCFFRRSSADLVPLEFPVENSRDREEVQKLWAAHDGVRKEQETLKSAARLWTFVLRLYDRWQRKARRDALIEKNEFYEYRHCPGFRLRLSASREEFSYAAFATATGDRIEADEEDSVPDDLLVLTEIEDQDRAFEAFQQHADAETSKAKKEALDHLLGVYHELKQKLWRGGEDWFVRIGPRDSSSPWVQVINAGAPLCVSMLTAGETGAPLTAQVVDDLAARERLRKGIEDINEDPKIDKVRSFMSGTVAEIVSKHARMQEEERVKKMLEEHSLPYFDAETEQAIAPLHLKSFATSSESPAPGADGEGGTKKAARTEQPDGISAASTEELEVGGGVPQRLPEFWAPWYAGAESTARTKLWTSYEAEACCGTR
eukprot:g7608.t1